MQKSSSLECFVAGQIWVCEYPVSYSGTIFSARMVVIRLTDGTLVLQSPCHIDDDLKQAILAIGNVVAIVAPGSFHYFHVESAQQAFPNTETYICPGVEQKCPKLQFDWVLGDRSPELWSGQLDQVLVRGAKIIWEVAFFHRASRTLILVDLIENIGDETPNVGLGLKLWWKMVFHMWNHPKPCGARSPKPGGSG